MQNRIRTKREIAYDKNISGLMTQIIRICKENDIAAYFYFDLAGPEDQTLACTSALLNHDRNTPASKLVGKLRLIGMNNGKILSDHVPMKGELGRAIFNPEYTTRDEISDLLKRPRS